MRVAASHALAKIERARKTVRRPRRDATRSAVFWAENPRRDGLFVALNLPWRVVTIVFTSPTPEALL